MKKRFRITSVCCECGKEVEFYTTLAWKARMFQGVKQAVCKTCDKKSGWRRVKGEVRIGG